MDDFSALLLGMQGRMLKSDRKIIDWSHVFHYITEYDIQNAEVGLEEDFNQTKGLLMKDGCLVYPLLEHSVYGIFLESTWATPILYDIDNSKAYPCYTQVPYESEKHFIEDYLELDEIKEISKNFEIISVEDL